METIQNWRGETIAVARSRGGVIACVDPYANLLRGGVAPWPPIELVQKLYQSRQARAFDAGHLAACKDVLGYYCDLQSINSEDALTWSCFGPLAYSALQQREAFTGALLEEIGIHQARVSEVAIWLWRRLPHPDSLVPGGPEIDFGIQGTEFLILGEAKWHSAVGKGQGVAKDKDQLQLREEFCNKYGPKLYPGCRDFVVLSAGPTASADAPSGVPRPNGVRVLRRAVSWSRLAELPGQPDRAELRSYIDWKTRLTLAA
jgi:hypothetical protein